MTYWLVRNLAASAAVALGQTRSPAAMPRFEVASIKLCNNQTAIPGGRGEKGGGGIRWSPGRLTVECQTVASMIRSAYLGFANGKPRPIDSHRQNRHCWSV